MILIHLPFCSFLLAKRIFCIKNLITWGQNGKPNSYRFWAQDGETVLWQQQIQVGIVGREVPGISLNSTLTPNYTVINRSKWRYGFRRKERDCLHRTHPMFERQEFIVSNEKHQGQWAKGISDIKRILFIERKTKGTIYQPLRSGRIWHKVDF